VQLHRDHDVVLIDANDPEAGGVFPVGRLREPLSALGRATEIVITRVEAGQDVQGNERRIRQYNLQAPIFGSRVIPREWVDAASGVASAVAELKFSRVAAFCGLGDPRAFWRTLEEMGIEVVMQREFGDHHRYRASELRQFAGQAAATGVTALITTEKDAMNLCEDAALAVAPLQLYWLRIGVEIDSEHEFLLRITQDGGTRD